MAPKLDVDGRYIVNLLTPFTKAIYISYQASGVGFMEYEKFRGIWHEALTQAGLMSMPPQAPLETIGLAGFL